MFFSSRIKNIKPNDFVLEVGPGGAPHPRSNVLLEKKYDSPQEAKAQRGFSPELKTNKKIVYFEGDRFPFKDKEFDYVICSHVLEHVDDVKLFLSELSRVGKAGYLEYPLAYYDFLYNIPEHRNFLKLKGAEIYWMPKVEAHLQPFAPFQQLFYNSLKVGYTSLVDDLKSYLFEGFEWFGGITAVRTNNMADLMLENISIPPKEIKKGPNGLLRLFTRK